MGLPGTVLGIPGYLVSRDPWDSMPSRDPWDSMPSRDPFDSMPSGTNWECPGYPRRLSISESWGSMPSGTVLDIPGYLVPMGLHAWWDYPGLSWVFWDT